MLFALRLPRQTSHEVVPRRRLNAPLGRIALDVSTSPLQRRRQRRTLRGHHPREIDGSPYTMFVWLKAVGPVALTGSYDGKLRFPLFRSGQAVFPIHSQ